MAWLVCWPVNLTITSQRYQHKIIRQTPPPPSVGSTHSNAYVCMVPKGHIEQEPLIQFWTMCFEAKHGFFKRVICNFHNIWFWPIPWTFLCIYFYSPYGNCWCEQALWPSSTPCSQILQRGRFLPLHFIKIQGVLVCWVWHNGYTYIGK